MADDDLIYYFKLVKSGYGSLEEVKQLDARSVMQALHYESFLNSYHVASIQKSRGT